MLGEGCNLMANDDSLSLKMRMIANDGQQKKYHYHVLRRNPRLDTMQKSILKVRPKRLDVYLKARNIVAGAAEIAFPESVEYSNPVFYLDTSLGMKNGKKDALQQYFGEENIPGMIYYPHPLYKQKAFQKNVKEDCSFPVTKMFCFEVVSIPVHTEVDKETLDYITTQIKFFLINNNQ